MTVRVPDRARTSLAEKLPQWGLRIDPGSLALPGIPVLVSLGSLDRHVELSLGDGVIYVDFAVSAQEAQIHPGRAHLQANQLHPAKP